MSNPRVTPEILSEFKKLLASGETERNLRRWFRHATGLAKSQANSVYNSTIKSLNKVYPENSFKQSESQKPYQFNPITRDYVFYIKSAARNVIIKEGNLQNILSAYSNSFGDERSIEDISRMLEWPKNYVIDLLKLLNFSHDSLPILPESIDSKTDDEILSDLDTQRKFVIKQKFEKREWQSIIKDAEEWRSFKYSKINPFESFLSRYSPPELKKFDYKSEFQDINSDRTFVVVLSDLHYGANAKSKYMFNRPEWNTEKTVECVDKFATEIVKEIDNRASKFKKCVILGLGDLIHSLDGKTQRGTELKYDYVREEQFDFALDSLLTFISRMADCFGECEIHSIYGNHNYETEMALFRALSMFFKKDFRVKFCNYSSRPAALRIDGTLILIDHGADGRERAYVPAIGAKLEKHVNTLLVNNPELLVGVKSKLFCQGDKHHFCHVEYGSFEFLMFSTSLGGCEHAAVNNLYNRARQSCMILDKSGLREVIHVYFD